MGIPFLLFQFSLAIAAGARPIPSVTTERWFKILVRSPSNRLRMALKLLQ